MTIVLRKSELVLDTTALVCQHFAQTPAVAEPMLPPTVRIHPIAFAIAVATAAWFVVAAWCAFAGGEASLILAVITFFCLIFFGLFAGGAAMARDMTAGPALHGSFREFLDGDVDIATGRVPGGDALWQIAAMPIGLAVGFTAIATIAVSV
jgi:hypothetical protein